jgi:hypothetical protein
LTVPSDLFATFNVKAVDLAEAPATPESPAK